MRLTTYLQEDTTSDAIEEWIGVRQSKSNFQDFRTGTFKKAKILQSLAKQTTDPILKKSHYRGMALTDEQINQKQIDLTSISSFTRSKKIAMSWAEGAYRTAKMFNLPNINKVIIEVPRLKHGFDVAPFAKSLTGQAETLTSGIIKITKIISNDSLTILQGTHQ